ncbi:unnamed protein product, partial [Owenia fusiformis]
KHTVCTAMIRRIAVTTINSHEIRQNRIHDEAANDLDNVFADSIPDNEEESDQGGLLSVDTLGGIPRRNSLRRDSLNIRKNSLPVVERRHSLVRKRSDAAERALVERRISLDSGTRRMSTGVEHKEGSTERPTSILRKDSTTGIRRKDSIKRRRSRISEVTNYGRDIEAYNAIRTKIVDSSELLNITSSLRERMKMLQFMYDDCKDMIDRRSFFKMESPTEFKHGEDTGYDHM